MTRRDAGQTTVLTIGYAVVALLLVAVVADLSRVFLAQRALDEAADAAAVAAVQALRAGTYYTGGAAGPLVLDPARARAAAERHLAAAHAEDACEAFSLDAVETGADVVTVTVSCRVGIPFADVVASTYAGGVPITGTASARLAVRP